MSFSVVCSMSAGVGDLFSGPPQPARPSARVRPQAHPSRPRIDTSVRKSLGTSPRRPRTAGANERGGAGPAPPIDHTPRGARRSVLVGADHLTAGPGAQGHEGRDADRVLDEL